MSLLAELYANPEFRALCYLVWTVVEPTALAILVALGVKLLRTLKKLEKHLEGGKHG